MSFDDIYEFQKEIDRAQKEQENKENLKSDYKDDFGFSDVLEERQKKKDTLRGQLLGLGLDDEDIDKLFRIISSAEKEIEEIKRAFDYKAKVSGSGEKMYNDNLFEYALMTDGTAIIHKYIGTATNLDINNSVKVDGKTYTIIGVADRVFEGNKIIKSVKLPNTITSVGSYTFKNCVNLESIVIPEGVTIIKAYAFEFCENLTNVSLPSTLLKIDDNAFNACYALTSIVLPNKLVAIGDYVFSSCHSLNSIIIPKSVISIGSSAFGNGCSITVYCEATSKPASWNSEWLYIANGNVVWGYTK